MIGVATKLLPASIPMRFFGAALLFHLLAWTMLAAGSSQAVGFAGGLGLPLGALHLLTLGVLTATVFGAGFQLLPVAVRTDPPALRLCRLAGWPLLAGVPLLAWGMAKADMMMLSIGGLAAALALFLFSAAVIPALRRADFSVPGVRIVALHLWAALAGLLALAVLGLALMGNFVHGYLTDHQTVAIVHLVLACYGFLGLLAVGFSHVLVPMFTLAPVAPERPVRFALGLGAAGLALAAAGWFVPAAGLGLAAAALHLHTMSAMMRARARKRLGYPFVLIRLSWIFLPVSLALGLALALGLLPGWGPALFGLALAGGWLLSLVLGMLQRILPFLASLYAVRMGRRMPKVADISSEALLKLQAGAHVGALAGVASGLVLGRPDLIHGGALVGAAGAAVLVLYALDIWLRVQDLPPVKAGGLQRSSTSALQ